MARRRERNPLRKLARSGIMGQAARNISCVEF
jgi:hypothetical protein